MHAHDIEFLPPATFVGRLLPDVASPARCSALVRMLAARGFEATGAQYPDDYRNNDRLVFDDPELAHALFADVRARLPATLDIDGEHWVLEGLNTRFRACRYTGGQAFCIHRDGAHVPTTDLRSHLTLQIYLDDDPARIGGDTRFYADPRGDTPWASIAPAIGTAIVFDHRVWHDGAPVTAGIKQVLRTDVMYRRIETTPVRHVATDDRVLYRHDGYAWQAIVCRDGSIASAGRDGTVRRWAEGSTATLTLGAGSVTRLVEATDGRLWCGTRSGRLFVVEGLHATEITLDDGAILGLAARPDGGVVASTARGRLVAFERNRSRAWSVQAHEGWAWTVLRDGARYVSAGHDGRLLALDDAGTATELARLDTSVRALASTGDTLLAGDTRGRLHIVGQAEPLPAHHAAITSLCVLADGRVVTAGEDATVRLWSDGVCQRTFSARDFVTSVAATRTGELVWTSYDGAVYRARL